MNHASLHLRPWERLGIRRDVEYLTDNIGQLLGSGVDVVSALSSVEGGMRSSIMKRLVHTIGERVAEGESLSALLGETGLFPDRTVALIKVGEENGQLVSYFKMIGLQEEKQRSFRAKIRSALMYPGFVFIMTIVVGVGVSWFILPRLSRVFFQLKIELPLITKIVLGFGAFLGEWGVYAVPLGAVALAALVYVVFFHRKTKRIGERLLMLLPGVRTLLQQVEMARLGFVLGGLLKGGIPITDAIASLKDATDSVYYKRLYEHIGGKIAAGESVADAFASYRRIDALVPQTVQQLLITASKSGTLAEVLLKLGASYEEQSDTSMRNLSVILEPVLLFIVWLAVVCVALGVILPIYDLIGGINRR